MYLLPFQTVKSSRIPKQANDYDFTVGYYCWCKETYFKGLSYSMARSKAETHIHESIKRYVFIAEGSTLL